MNCAIERVRVQSGEKRRARVGAVDCQTTVRNMSLYHTDLGWTTNVAYWSCCALSALGSNATISTLSSSTATLS